MLIGSPLRGALAAAAIAAGLALPAHAQQLDFVPFETEGVSNPDDLEHIEFRALLIFQGDDLLVRISNESPVGTDWITGAGPTITRIHFDSEGGQLGTPSIVGTSGKVKMYRDDSINLPGGNSISFDTDLGFRASAPPSKFGIDPGESIDILFEGTTATAFLDSPFARIGLKVQQIGDDFEDSASYISVPETSTALLGALGLLVLMRRRR